MTTKKLKSSEVMKVEIKVIIHNQTFESIEQIIDKLDVITKKYPNMVLHVEVQF